MALPLCNPSNLLTPWSRLSPTKNLPAAREGAADAISALVSTDGAVKSLEPTFVDSGIYNALLEAFADKMPAVRTAAVEAVRLTLLP
jgi:elongation factor 3